MRLAARRSPPRLLVPRALSSPRTLRRPPSCAAAYRARVSQMARADLVAECHRRSIKGSGSTKELATRLSALPPPSPKAAPNSERSCVLQDVSGHYLLANTRSTGDAAIVGTTK